MQLDEIIGYLNPNQIIGKTNIEINGLCTNSQKVRHGDLFFCYAGGKHDSHENITEAIANGAVAVICEKKLNCSVTQIVVDDGRSQMARVARVFYKFPEKSLKIVGITGTNGKTTT